jgi:hypothetical protein
MHPRWSLIVVALGGMAVGYALSAPSGVALAADDGATTRASATFEVYKDKADEFRWRLRTRINKSSPTPARVQGEAIMFGGDRIRQTQRAGRRSERTGRRIGASSKRAPVTPPKTPRTLLLSSPNVEQPPQSDLQNAVRSA